MDFALTHEQTLLGDMLARLLAGEHGWGDLAELGVLGACLPEAHDGSGGGGVETMVIMQALGRAGSRQPYLGAIVLGAGVIAAAGSGPQREAILPRVAAGELALALAHAEPASRFRLAHATTRAAALPGGGFVLDGVKGIVPQGQHASMLIVSARLAGGAEDEAGIGLFLLPADAPGVGRREVATQDGHGGAIFTLDGVRLPQDARLGNEAIAAIRHVHDAAIAAVCAEALGAMEECLRLTLEYLRTRRQFGQAIGAFQALQHRAVDMFVALELARSMTMYAAVMADEADAGVRARAMSAAKIRVARSARAIAQEAIQLHGAIGLTEEYALGHHARRLAMIEMQFGDVDHHAALLAADA